MSYLEEVGRRDLPAGAHTRSHVHTAEMADVARGIVEHVDELAPDLIVMCTHGRGGVGDLLYGTIAQQVVGRATTPVLLVRPGANASQPAFRCQQLLVALDGNPEHEEGLSLAAELAEACGAAITLVLVVPTLGKLAGREAATGLMLPGATRLMLELAEQDAEAYLRRHQALLEQQGVPAAASVRRGDPVQAIVDCAREVAADMIVLGTHGKTGTDAFWSGSLSPKISGRWHSPLMLVPVGRPEPATE
jgi:nucleotide-binding universal stress UspA family protein